VDVLQRVNDTTNVLDFGSIYMKFESLFLNMIIHKYLTMFEN